jgi:hypothetical protein
MTKVLTVDDIEVEFEKQNPSTSCKWCVYLRVRKDDKEKLLLMFKTNNKPYTKFTYDSGNIITNSKKTLKEILSETMNAVDDLRDLEKQSKEDHEK